MTGPATDLPEAWELPSFETYELAARKHDYCLIIPVINEGSRFTDQLRRLAALAPPVDVIIADGGSSDGSMGIDGLLLFGVRTLLVKTGPGKLSAQLRMGFAYAIMQGYLGIIIVDGNGKDGVEAVPSFVTALREGYDFVQGSRYVPGGVAINTPLDRTLAVKLFHAPLLSIAARFRYTDTTNGFRAFSRRFLLDGRVQPFRDVFDSYNLHYYLSIRAPRLGFRVCELPVRRAYPAGGQAPTKIRGLAGRLLIIRQLLLSVTGAYDPPP
jgi:dolichol-phosphate mannosyltransferase